MNDSINSSHISNVIPIKKWTNTREDIDDIDDILVNIKSYNWTKNDIIWALLSNGTLNVDIDSVDCLLDEEYSFLYNSLSDFLCSVWEVSYFEMWYTFEFNKNEKCIYLVDIGTIRSNISHRLDIKLITKQDYSSTSIEISYKGNIMLILSEEWYGMTWYIPWYDDF